MSNEGPDSQIQIGVAMTANTGPGADKAISDITRVKEAEAGATGATEQAAASDARVAQIVQEYGVNAQEAARALELLGPAASTAAIGSAELEAAVEAAQRETAELAVSQERATAIAKEYNTSLQAVARALELLGPAAGTAAIGSAELEAAIEAANIEIAAGNVARGEALALMRETTAAEMAALEAEEAAAAGGANLAGVSEAVAAALTRLSIAQTEVAATAQRMSVSQEIAARALIQMKQADIASEVSRVRAELEALAAPAIDAAAATASVGDAAAAAGGKTVNSFGRGSPAFHAMVATSNISRGGAIAMRGWMEAAELAGVAFGGIVGPIILVSAVLGEIIARHEEFANKGKKSIDEVKGAWDEANTVFNRSLKELGENKTFGGLLDDAKKFSDELHIQETALHTIQAALDRLEDAKFGAQEQTLNLREQQDLQGKSGEDAERIRLSYEQQHDVLRAQYEQDKAIRDLKAKQAELIDLQNQRLAKQAEAAAADADVQNVHDTTSSGATRASLGQSDYEYARDTKEALEDQQKAAAAGQADSSTGELIRSLTADQWTILANVSRELPRLHQEEVDKGPQYTEQIDRLKKQRDDLEKQEGADLEDAQKGGYDLSLGQTQDQAIAAASAAINQKYAARLDEIEGLIQAFTKTQDGYVATSKSLETAAKTFQDVQKSVADLDVKIAAAQTDIQTAAINLQTATVKGTAQSSKDTNAESALDTKASRAIRDNELDAKIAHIEALLKAAPEEAKRTYQAQLDQLLAEQVQNKASDEKSGLTQYPQEAQSVQDKANAEAGKDTTLPPDKKAERSEEKEQELQIKAVTETIEKSGNRAAIGQLQQVIASHLSTLQTLPVLMQILLSAHLKLQTQVDDLGSNMHRLKSP